jgi:hypothetical protein
MIWKLLALCELTRITNVWIYLRRTREFILSNNLLNQQRRIDVLDVDAL